MKYTTKLSIFIGSIASMIPYSILMNEAGILLTIICFFLTIELSNWALEDKK